MNPSNLILHLTPAAEFNAQPATAPYRAASLASEGFIHCTREPEVLLQIANALYRETPGEFVVLGLDRTRLTAEVKDEPPAPRPRPDHPFASILFPHIYGPINREAIVFIRTAQRAPDGSFVAL